MTDSMDKLLFDIGREANAEVDFSATLNLLLKEQEKQRKKKAMLLRYCGAAAAALVLLVGVTTLMPSFGKDAEAEAPAAAESAREYSVATAQYAAGVAEAYVLDEAVEDSAPAAAPVAEEAPAPAEEAGASRFEAPAEEAAPLAPETEEFEEAAAEESSAEVFTFEGIYYAAFNPAFTDPADLDRLGLPHSITPDMVGEELGSAAALGSGEPFPVYACPGVNVSGVLILGGDAFLLPVNLLGEGVQ